MAPHGTVVYVDPIGDPDRDAACYFQCDLEIVKKKGPKTRQRTRERLTGQVYRMMLYFSHDETTAVIHIELDDTQIRALQIFASHYNDNDSYSGSARDMVMKCHRNKGAVLFASGSGTYVTRRGLLKLLSAIRVKDFLDRYERMETMLPGYNRKLTQDCICSCAMYVAKFAADYIQNRDETGQNDDDPAEMDQKEYSTVVKELADDKDYSQAYKMDAMRLYDKVKELLGLEYEMHPNFFTVMCNHLRSSPNVFNENMSQWRDEDLFVRGVWNVHFR